MRAVVIGGGVAGLAAAVALRRVGVDAVVYERARKDAARGFGFFLLPNGLRALETLGILNTARALGCRVGRAWMRAADGRTLSRTMLPESLCIRRDDLLDLLRSELPDDAVRAGMAFDGFDHSPDGAVVRARFEDGHVDSGDLYVGADGVRSQVRDRLFPGHPCAAGRIKELVGSVYAPGLSVAIGPTFIQTSTLEGGLAFGMVPSTAGRLIWFLQFDSRRWYAPGDDAARRRKFLLARMKGWAEPIPAVLKRVDFADVHLWHTADVELLPRMCHGNVALIGDAAHTVLPFTSQGANSALEDAVELAECLDTVRSAGGRPRDALVSFDAIRRPPLQRYRAAGRALADAFVRPRQRDETVSLPLVMET